ncbi:glycosyltransferase family 1 protein [Camillea tinctor]|nr:glycosyltransferase family 1 protein [Camillea tinctor]
MSRTTGPAEESFGTPQSLPPTTSHPPSHIPSDIPQQTSNNSIQNLLEEQKDLKDINQDHQSCLEAMDVNRDRYIPNILGGIPEGTTSFLLTLSLALLVTIAILAIAEARGMQVVRILPGVWIMLAIASWFWVRHQINDELVRSGVTGHYVAIVCGSGGHTAEMIQMIERSIRPEKSCHRRWVIGRGDENSYHKVMTFERRLLRRFSKNNFRSGTFDIVWFDRARAVHQSWLTTPFTAITSFLGIFSILVAPPIPPCAPKFRFPGVIVTNGPGTGFLILLAARVLKILLVVPRSHMRTIYVESWARVKSLSLTGKLIRRCKLADLFIVQSRQLAQQQGIFAENLPAMPVRLDIPVEPEN